MDEENLEDAIKSHVEVVERKVEQIDTMGKKITLEDSIEKYRKGLHKSKVHCRQPTNFSVVHIKEESQRSLKDTQQDVISVVCCAINDPR